MTLSIKQELLCWLIGGVVVVELFDYSSTFNVVAATYYCGLALLFVIASLFWLKFRKRLMPEPRWLRILAISILVFVSATFLIYLLGGYNVVRVTSPPLATTC
jgi:drug/metabolite transporter (DMT)-like permease